MGVAERVASDCVILLHGLARTTRSMKPMQRFLTRRGFTCLNIGYPSTRHSIEDLCRQVRPEVDAAAGQFDRLHFVTHSMGGILLRQMHAERPIANLGRCVMLGPPNRGSHVVDRLGGWTLFGWVNGPAGRQLGTGPNSVPNRLGPIDFEAGVLAGDRSINWILSLMLPKPNDGKVAVSHAAVEGQRDFKTLHVAHPFLAKNREAMTQTAAFLREGTFARE